VNLVDLSIYKEFAAMKEEVMKHKWLESEKVGYDIGFSKALIDWTIKFKTTWFESRKKEL
jgi:hypothetical protein